MADDQGEIRSESESTESPEPAVEAWEFAGWGTAERISELGSGPIRVTTLGTAMQHKLGQLKATAICGNDITSSCLYVSALCAIQAGKYAPIALAIVAVVLYLFRRIYAEVGSALPLNGGAYNVLLNTTSKAKASLAACLTLLSYMATAVISANEAMHYAANFFPQYDKHEFALWTTVGLLAIFAFLNYLGITESAVVALGIFVFHLLTLTVLVLASGIKILGDSGLFWQNWATTPEGGLGYALFFGFAAALLGISGFESSANFIEEQEPGVFPKTLRNMWIAVAIFNPLISLLSMGLIPVQGFEARQEDLLAYMGDLSWGSFLKWWVSLDAVLVLSGAVLTSFVGVTGLVRRMSLDRCLPQFLLRENRWRETNHWIILLFFLLCCSIQAITSGKVKSLGGVYTLSFLSVMALFAVGNMLLKSKRGRLPRAVRASWPAVMLALCAVCAGIAGNVIPNPMAAPDKQKETIDNVQVFFMYFSVTVVVVAVMFLRIQILKVVLLISRAVVERVQAANAWISRKVLGKIDEIASQKVVFFTRGDNAANLNSAALYVRANEQTKRLIVVHVFEAEEEIPPNLAEDLRQIDRLYPELRIDFVAVRGKFGPELIERLSRRLDVPKNYMFIGCPGDRFPHQIDALGGVRLIM
jgi:amino acid transporter